MMTLLLSLVGLVILGMVALLIYAGYVLWRDHEEAKAEQEQVRRSELEACLALTHTPPNRPGPKGFGGRNGRAA